MPIETYSELDIWHFKRLESEIPFFFSHRALAPELRLITFPGPSKALAGSWKSRHLRDIFITWASEGCFTELPMLWDGERPTEMSRWMMKCKRWYWRMILKGCKALRVLDNVGNDWRGKIFLMAEVIYILSMGISVSEDETTLILIIWEKFEVGHIYTCS